MTRKRDVNLTTEQKFSPTIRQGEWLDIESKRLGLPRSEIVRRALDDYIDRRQLLIPRKTQKRDRTPAGQSKMPLQQAA